MKTMLTNLAPAFALGAVLTISALAQEKVAPGFTAEQLTERTLHRRAMEAVTWGMPAVNAELMFQSDEGRPSGLQPGPGRSAGKTRP